MYLSRMKTIMMTAAAALTLAACGGGWTPTTVSGSVTGLANGASLILTNSPGITYQVDESITVTSNGAFKFTRTFSPGTAYNVHVSSQPAGQFCSVANGTGTIDKNADAISNIVVSCVPAATISVTVQGMTSGQTLELRNLGVDPLDITANGTYSFASAVPSGNSYNVGVFVSPTNQICTVNNGTGTVGTPPVSVTNVTVTCANATSLSGTLSGLNGGVLILNINNGNLLPVSANGTFVTSNFLTPGTPWQVAISTQPASQYCVASGPTSGTIDAAGDAVTNLAYTCSAAATIGGTITGMTASANAGMVLANNGTDLLNIGGNGNGGAFTFANAIPAGGTYNVTVKTNPVGSNGQLQTCTVTNGSGTVGATPTAVTNVQIACQ